VTARAEASAVPKRPGASLTCGRTLLLDGVWTEGAAKFSREDPARGDRQTGCYASADSADTDRAFAAADRAQPGWAATPAPARAEILRTAADLLTARLEEAAERLTLDMGKAIRDARAEVLRSVAILRYFGGELFQPEGETYPSSDPDTTLMTVEQPLGVVCAITPWNFPFAIPTWKLAPAIGFGNAVVWKAAEAASGSAVLLTEIFLAAGLPNGVLNLLTGSGSALSSALTGDARLAALTFTGSGAVGVRLRQAVADRNVKVQLELGGKNPAIVLADADLEDAAIQVARGAMLSTGQRCTATSRVFVERSIAPRFRDLLCQRVNAFQVGDPREETTDIGPLASTEQRDTVMGYLRLAERENAQTLTGGTLAGDSCFAAPTVLTGVKSDSALMRDEIFGPVLVVQEIANFQEALDAANDTEFGLSSALFTRDLAKALRFIRESQSGVVHVNRETAGAEPHVPFGGLKGSSSMSREQGKAARAFFTTTKTVYLRAVA